MPRTVSEIQAELAQWYKARERVSSGKSFSVSTSAGSRQVSLQDLDDINRMINQLERQLQQKQKNLRSPFAFADFNNDIPR